MAKLIERSAKKTRKLDPMPTPLVVNCVDSLLLVITKIINLSLSTGSFSDEWKCAIVNYNTALAFPQYPCNGSSHTFQTEVKESKLKEHLRILISSVAFPKVLASVHCFTSFTQQSCLKSLSTIFLMHIAMLTTHSYISALHQRMDCHLRLSFKQSEDVLRT